MNWLLRLFGIKRIKPPVLLPDGTLFQVYPAQDGPDWGWIIRGCTDLSGNKWAAFNNGKPCWNSCELTGPWFAKGPNDPILDRIRQYHAPLRESVSGWPAIYRDAYNESHK